MSKTLFNRNDPKVIAAAKECAVVEEFISLYKDSTTATEKTLNQAFYELKYGKMAAIRTMSGSTDNNEPIEPILQTTKKTEIMAKKEVVEEKQTPKPKRLETHDGEQVMVPADQIEKMEPVEVANAKAVAKANKGVKAPKAEKVKVEKVPKAEKPAAGPTKQDKIKELLIGGATNKEIKLLLAEEGFKVYDSEILSAKNKLKPQE